MCLGVHFPHPVLEAGSPASTIFIARFSPSEEHVLAVLPEARERDTDTLGGGGRQLWPQVSLQPDEEHRFSTY